jgi:hypothetical protein
MVLGTLAFDAAPALADCIHGNGKFRGVANSWRIFQNALPPADTAPATTLSYNSWPLTDAFTWNQGSGSSAPLNTSTWNGRVWLYVWANRAVNTHNPKPNPIQSPPPMIGDVECRVEYSTVELANAATQCQIRHWLGMTNWALPWTQIAGNSIHDFVKYSDLVATPGAYFRKTVRALDTTYRVMTDRPWLLSLPDGSPFTRRTMMGGRIGHVPGVVLDYEVADLRGPAVTTAFLKAIYADIGLKATKLFLYTDPLDRTGVSGLDATNLPAIAQSSCDYLTVMLWGQNPGGNVAQSYASQIAILQGPARDQAVPWGKITLLYELNNTTLADAQFAFDTLSGPAATSPQAICFWPNGATQGGLCGANRNAAGVPVNHLTIAALQGSAATGTKVAATSA